MERSNYTNSTDTYKKLRTLQILEPSGYKNFINTCKNPIDIRAREDKTRQDKTRQDKTRQDKTRQDKTRQDKTRKNKTRQDKEKRKTKKKKRGNGGLSLG